MTTKTNSDGVTTWAYGYDASGRLTSATQQGLFNHSYIYTYDAAGNRTSEQIDGNTSTESANSVNQLTNQSGTSTSISYDLAGNETTKVGAAGGYVFDWDGANRCTAIGSSDFQFSIAYDGLNRWTHITQCDANCTNLLADRWFVWNGNTLTEERDSSGTLIQRFYANGFWRAGTNYFYIRDHMGSVRQVTDQNGITVAKFNYDPYGRRTQTFGTMWIDYGYAGLFELPNGLKLADFRIYDPSTGRWINRDPIREQGGWNMYAYCEGNPVSNSDTSGLKDWSNRETAGMLSQAVNEMFQKDLLAERLIWTFNVLNRDGKYDFKSRYAADTFCLHGERVRADAFGNYFAGLMGQFLSAKLPWNEVLVADAIGSVGVKGAGSAIAFEDRLYRIITLQDSTQAAKEILLSIPFALDDYGSVKYIQMGQLDAILIRTRKHL